MRFGARGRVDPDRGAAGRRHPRVRYRGHGHGGARCLGVARQARNYQQAREAMAQVEVEEPLALVEDMERANDAGTLRSPYERFRWERKVEPVGLEEDYLYQVTTSISWTEEGRQGGESVVTLVYRPDQKGPGGSSR